MKKFLKISLMFLLIAARHPCDDPKAVVEINGVTYSGILRVTHDEVMQVNDLYKSILFDKSLSQVDKARKLRNVEERIQHMYNRLRYCREYDDDADL